MAEFLEIQEWNPEVGPVFEAAVRETIILASDEPGALLVLDGESPVARTRGAIDMLHFLKPQAPEEFLVGTGASSRCFHWGAHGKQLEGTLQVSDLLAAGLVIFLAAFLDTASGLFFDGHWS